MKNGLFDELPREAILSAFERSPGNEVASGKFASPESSALLAANAFGLFIDGRHALPPVPGTEAMGWPATEVAIEACARFPWYPRGQSPWLDAMAETPTHLIGIESKRYEPFRGKARGAFSDAYWRPVWGDGMGPFEAVRDALADGRLRYERLDAFQLVKHAFGLVTEVGRRGKTGALVYLYAEPSAWSDDSPLDAEAIAIHRRETQDFADRVAGGSVAFRACRYRDLLDRFRQSDDAAVRRHADRLADTFRP